MFLAVAAHGQVQTIDEQKLDAFAHAVADAEGFGVKHAIPTRCHNPGDIRIFVKGVHYPGQVGVTRHGYVIFKNDAAGFAALKVLLTKIYNGQSKHYKPDMSIAKIGKIYASGSRVWGRNVARNLGVEPTVTLAAFLRETDVPPPDLQFDSQSFPLTLLAASPAPVLIPETTTPEYQFPEYEF